MDHSVAADVAQTLVIATLVIVLVMHLLEHDRDSHR